MSTQIDAPLREFLEWVDRAPRTYDDAMQAWRSSCPRLTVWEDALHAGLVTLTSTGTFGKGAVTLTQQGRDALASTDPRGIR